MTKLIFAPEMFTRNCLFEPRNVSAIAHNIYYSYLKEHGRVVYGDTVCNWHETVPTEHRTHKAILIEIEELPKAVCVHEPGLETIITAYGDLSGFDDSSYKAKLVTIPHSKCLKCGAAIRAKGWVAV